MPELISALADLLVLGEEPIHRSLGAEVAALIEQGGIDLSRGGIDEALGVQHCEHLAAFAIGEPAGRSAAGRRHDVRFGSPPAPAVEGSPGDTQGAAGCLKAERAPQALDRVHQLVVSRSSALRLIPRISETFFWISMMVSACWSLRRKREFSRSRSLTRA